MNLSQKIGQLLIVGFKGTTVNEEIYELITQYHVGNIILFEDNCQCAEQVFHLVQELQKIAIKSNGVPLFVTIDQENGIVTRLYDGVTVFPGNMAQAAGATLEETKQIAYATGVGLKALGINFNLAPSLDVNNNPHNPVIGIRSFGETANDVAMRGNAYIEGLQQAGIIATAKHFPGHGDTSIDSHLALPVVAHEKERLNKVELYPFKEAIKMGVKAIMIAHIRFMAYEKEEVPATLSYPIVTKLLREELGYQGLIITDCMEMKAIDTEWGTAKAVPMAIQAGADLICISHTKEKQLEAIQEIYQAIEEGWIDEARLDQSLERILKAKREWNSTQFMDMTYEEARKYLYQEDYEKLAKKVSLESITLVKNEGVIPIRARDILVIAPNGRVLTGADGTRIAPNFATFFKERISDRKVEAYEIDNLPTKEQVEEAVKKVKERELIICCTHNGILAATQLELVRKVTAINPNVILLPMRIPYDIEVLEEVKGCLLSYEYTTKAMESLIQVLMGKAEPKGKLPVTLK